MPESALSPCSLLAPANARDPRVDLRSIILVSAIVVFVGRQKRNSRFTVIGEGLSSNHLQIQLFLSQQPDLSSLFK